MTLRLRCHHCGKRRGYLPRKKPTHKTRVRCFYCGRTYKVIDHIWNR